MRPVAQPESGDLPDPTRCPLCGAGNACALEAERATGIAQPPCWCMSASFGEALLSRVPPAARRKACICARCAAAAARAADGGA
jgi:hypothetical protein